MNNNMFKYLVPIVLYILKSKIITQLPAIVYKYEILYLLLNSISCNRYHFICS